MNKVREIVNNCDLKPLMVRPILVHVGGRDIHRADPKKINF